MCEERGSRQPIVWETKYFFTEVSINIKQKAKTFLYKTKVEKLIAFGPLLAVHASILLMNADWSGTDLRLITTRDPSYGI